MRILLDVDGVVADMIGALLKKVNPEMTEQDVKHWDLSKVFTQREMKLVNYIMKDHHFWNALEPYPGVFKQINKFRNLGHDIVFVSAPYWRCKKWTNVRRDWLSAFFPNPKFIATDHKECVAGEVFVDDKPENIMAWSKENPDKQALLFNRPWNRNTSYLASISSLDGIFVTGELPPSNSW